ncbi:MAG: IclR family transcriptional regulator [Microbacterium sp.]|uniref:IclR family transcriptional regulator n=1 Tax=Microbacterium sp. TaxID=51671 RepID=UPI00324268BC
MRNTANRSGRVESVYRALMLLDVIVEEGSLNVTDAAQRLGVHMSTAQRLLATLVAADYVRQDSSRRYIPGNALFRLPRPLISARQRLHPFLLHLHERTGETIHLATLIGTEVHHPDAIESPHPLRFGLRTGVRVPAHITSEGKSMLASLPWNDVEARYSLALSGERAHAWNLDLEQLKRTLEEVRSNGYATNYEESEPGIAAYSMMIGVLDGELCAFSVAMPIARHTPEFGESLIVELRRTILMARDQLNIPDPYQPSAPHTSKPPRPRADSPTLKHGSAKGTAEGLGDSSR